MSAMTKERWVVTEGIPGIASKDEIVIVRPNWGILVTRWLPMSRYPDLMKYRDVLSPLSPEPRRLKLID